jgi:hypothetical protein
MTYTVLLFTTLVIERRGVLETFISFFGGQSMRESKYQYDLIKKIYDCLPGCLIIKNDPSKIQGIPDLLVLYEDRWAMLEVKRSINEDAQPNQEHYVKTLNQMSFAAFIYPENEEEVLDALQSAFGLKR